MYYHLDICFMMLAQILKIRSRDASDLKTLFFHFFGFGPNQNVQHGSVRKNLKYAALTKAQSEKLSQTTLITRVFTLSMRFFGI